MSDFEPTPKNQTPLEAEKIDPGSAESPVSVGDAVGSVAAFGLLAALLIRFRTPSGRTMVTNAEIEDARQARTDDGFRLLRRMASALISGNADVATWERGMALELRRAHLQMTALGKRGWGNITASDLSRVQERLRSEYEYLARFGREISEGALSEAQILARVQLYENGVQSSYWRADTEYQRASQDMTQERRIVNQAAENCSDCVGYEVQGWVAIGSLPAPGEGSVCLSNCKCTKEYR